MMTQRKLWRLLGGIALLAAGCSILHPTPPEQPAGQEPPTLAALQRDAVSQTLLWRNDQTLKRVAAEQFERRSSIAVSDLLLRLESGGSFRSVCEDFRLRPLEDSIIFCYALTRPGAKLDDLLKPISARRIECDQALALSRLEAMQADSAERTPLLLEISTASGWPQERLLQIDLSALATPHPEPLRPAPETVLRILVQCGSKTAPLRLAQLLYRLPGELFCELAAKGGIEPQPLADTAVYAGVSLARCIAESYLKEAFDDYSKAGSATEKSDALLCWREAWYLLEYLKALPLPPCDAKAANVLLEWLSLQ